MAAGMHRKAASPAITALLLVQICLGYEWLVSGVTKVAHGDFPAGLSSSLAEMGKQAPGWYRGLLTDAFESHAVELGYAIEVCEVLLGVVLLGGAILLLARGSRLAPRNGETLQLAIGAASILGILLLANFELANGGGFGLRLASDSFDEGIDLDTMMIGLHLALLVFALRALPIRARMRLAVAGRAARPGSPGRAPVRSELGRASVG